MKKHLGKVSFAFLITIFIFYASIVGKEVNHTFVYFIALIVFVLSVISALLSEKGRWKTIALTSIILVFVSVSLILASAFFIF
jgi:hypothetical protein